MMAAGRRSNTSRTAGLDLLRANFAVPNVSTITETGPSDTDRIRDLDLAALGDPGGDDMLGDPAGRICGRAVDLRRVLAAERAAAVAGRAAVGVDDDLATGEAGVSVRAAEHEIAGRVGRGTGSRRPRTRPG